MENNRRSPSPKPKSPRSKRSTAAKRLEKMNQEQLMQAMKRKKECDAKAQKVVEKLLDPLDEQAELIVLLKEINQSHYQDIVEERAIMKLCGYPLCKERLGEIPSQQFHISTTSTKVFDLTERKHFCSGKCLRASNYVKVQLLTSPLWLRNSEVIPEFKLLSLD